MSPFEKAEHFALICAAVRKTYAAKMQNTIDHIPNSHLRLLLSDAAHRSRGRGEHEKADFLDHLSRLVHQATLT